MELVIEIQFVNIGQFLSALRFVIYIGTLVKGIASIRTFYFLTMIFKLVVPKGEEISDHCFSFCALTQCMLFQFFGRETVCYQWLGKQHCTEVTHICRKERPMLTTEVFITKLASCPCSEV